MDRFRLFRRTSSSLFKDGVKAANDLYVAEAPVDGESVSKARTPPLTNGIYHGKLC
jgi:hypothetical protein